MWPKCEPVVNSRPGARPGKAKQKKQMKALLHLPDDTKLARLPEDVQNSHKGKIGHETQRNVIRL